MLATEGFIILLFIPFCIFKVFHNLKYIFVEDLKKGLGNLVPR